MVDDEQTIRELVRDILELSGYEVDERSTAVGLVDVIRSTGPDCVVLDVMMPLKDGEIALGDIASAGLTTPVILYSAKHTEEAADVLRMKGQFLGASDYIAKPFDLERLVKSVRKYCGEPTAR